MNNSENITVFNTIDIWMDNYDDVFSDFDPALYTKRAISEDFINEILRREKETKQEIKIRLSVPESIRSLRNEAVIKKRLSDYFTVNEKKLSKEARKERNLGINYFIGGFIILTLLIINESIAGGNIQARILSTVMAPFGWFGMWEGLHHLLEGPKELIKQKNYYNRLSKARYEFYSEEELIKLARTSEENKQLTQED